MQTEVQAADAWAVGRCRKRQVAAEAIAGSGGQEQAAGCCCCRWRQVGHLDSGVVGHHLALSPWGEAGLT